MASQDDRIQFEHKGVGALLSQNRLVVPLNQREYSWEEEHVNDLFSDFANAIATNKGSYFLGTVVLTKGAGDWPEVSDGQQRLATTTILLASIRDYFFSHGDHKRAQHIAQTFLCTTDLRTTETAPRLRLNVDDHEFFRKFVISDPNSDDRAIKATKESHEKIAAGARIAAKYIQSLLTPHKESVHVDRLVELVNFVMEGAQIIVLRVPDHLNAFVMFETLNDRGLKASQADLLKNHLLSYCGDRINEGQQKWAKMVGVLESLGLDEITVTYLHHLVINKFGPTREREVFDKIKTSVNNQLRAIEFLDEMADGANYYAALFNADHKQWNEYGTTTKKNISTINRDLRVEQIRPLMLSVARKFPVTEAKIAFRLFVFWSVRFLIAGGRGGLLDRNYSLRAQEITNGTIKTAKELTEKLADILPSDAVFSTAFSEAKISQSWLARYFLRALEQTVKAEPEPEFVPSDEEATINLEHVMPEHPDASWLIDPSVAAAWYKRIGNLVLLQAKRNSIIGNSSYLDKKPILAQSAFLLTSSATKSSTWGTKEIEDRQKALATLAIKTWPLSIS
jgi:hypothetical protein